MDNRALQHAVALVDLKNILLDESKSLLSKLEQSTHDIIAEYHRYCCSSTDDKLQQLPHIESLIAVNEAGNVRISQMLTDDIDSFLHELSQVDAGFREFHNNVSPTEWRRVSALREGMLDKVLKLRNQRLVPQYARLLEERERENADWLINRMYEF